MLPPFAVVRYLTLSLGYPALFAQFRRALAIVANLYFGANVPYRHAADSAADLLNATLDRIRRSLPELATGLSQEIYADEKYQLRSR